MILVCDTGPLVAAALTRERQHRLCAQLLRSHSSDRLIVPVTVMVEVDQILRARDGPRVARAFFSEIDARRFETQPIAPAVLLRAIAVDAQYADADLGIVDASVVAVAEDVEADAILTLDHADFRLAAPGFTLLPPEHEL